MGPQPATGLQRGGFFWQPIDACMSIRRQPGGFFFTNFVLPHDFRYKHAPPASHGRQPAAPVTGAMPKVFDWFQCNACNLFLPLVQPYPVTPRRCNRCIAEGTLDPAFFSLFFCLASTSLGAPFSCSEVPFSPLFALPALSAGSNGIARVPCVGFALRFPSVPCAVC